MTPTLRDIHFVQGHPANVCNTIVQQFIQNQSAILVHYMYYASYFRITVNNEMLATYAHADYILPDGIGMQLCFLPLVGKWIINLNGTDLSPLFIDNAVKHNIPVVFYGTTKENIKGCADRFHRDKGIAAAYYQDGYSSLDFSKVPDGSLLVVGIGSPRQEVWAASHHDIIRQKKLLVVTAGGFLDFYCGYYIRAPKIVRTFKLEWLWRTILHPHRHYPKRLRDMTVVFWPLVNRILGKHKQIHIIEM